MVRLVNLLVENVDQMIVLNGEGERFSILIIFVVEYVVDSFFFEEDG